MSIAIQDEIKVFENEPEELEESNDELDGNRGSFDLEQVPQGQRTRRSSIFTITSIGHYAHQATNEVVHTVGQLQHEASKVNTYVGYEGYILGTLRIFKMKRGIFFS